MRTDPWNTMRAVMDEMDRWARTGLGRRGQELADALGYLPLDVAETAEAYILSAELPGVTMDAVAVNVEDNVITITGNKPAPEDTENVRYHRIERPYGSFQRSLALPRNVDPDQVSAKYEAGVLTITVGKREEAKPKRIEIQAGS
ncbi:MAG: Hsp20/alpha crystallin family protein [Armatimonadetes bacterium]|jgi:HSP20 family protein|nr:Hsp20/alpha crystallin family protein [Armatimonadota bacterium]MDI9583844.1 Hsp20/alpha crystallin family protein [Acidobacteriota bacterium]